MIFKERNEQANPGATLMARDYPSPPSVPWWLLALAFTAWNVLIDASGPYHLLLESLPAAAWAFYLCRWIRSLESDASSPFWCDIAVVVELTYSALVIRRNSSPAIGLTVEILGFASSALGLVTVFLIRSDLERHYSEHEPIGLQLSGVMTFFFNFLYFQYHLREIALYKKSLVKEPVCGGEY